MIGFFLPKNRIICIVFNNYYFQLCLDRKWKMVYDNYTYLLGYFCFNTYVFNVI